MMSSTHPGTVDWRGLLPRANWTIGQRQKTTNITVHYNGPAVPERNQAGDGLLAQLKADARYQMRAGWGGTINGADGLQYHFCVAADGQVYQTRDIEALLWHCGHADGNGRGLAIHLPLGGGQDATGPQWWATEVLIESLRARYNIALNRVVGHLEWKHATACPGRLQPRVLAYRAHIPPAPPKPTPTPGLRRFEVKREFTLPTRVRVAPRVTWPDGRPVEVAGRLKPGTLIYVDVVKTDGQKIDGDSRWVHMARVANEQADLGFLHWSVVKEV